MKTKKELFEEVKQNIEYEIINANKHSCCFTGHRPQNCPWGFNEKDYRCKKVKKEVKKIIIELVIKGYTNFYVGMALGFDTYCAEILIKLKRKYKQIKIIGAIPCEDQDFKWSYKDKIRYKKLISKLDKIRCIYKTFNKNCFLERNYYMVNNSSICVALFNGKPGGTQNTINYAKKQGLEIIIIKP